ncbi:collectin-12-like isoform X3 [Daphnia pulicaria]|uniref:collectin-12-like isoform X3 n=1 Tax=Daphnia pulicaria TaxID=35523 RepID=UPI001EEC24D6|nr:collectin-12-like isoform X3 [Daphnia pulicaria]
MNTIHFFVAIAVVACWAISATAQTIPTTVGPTTTRPPYPPGVCGKYFPYISRMTCWEWGGKCYCGGDRENWEGAYESCLEQNMTLLTIETPEEDKMIDDFFQLNHEYSYSEDAYWTSGKYSDLGSQWEWNPDWFPVDDNYGNDTTTAAPATPPPGTPMGYTNWYPGRPNNNKDGHQHCLGLVFFYGVTYENGHWDEFSCDSFYHFICEASP